MKTKKIIAIGMVATMTVGMSVSAFASEPLPNYSNAPVVNFHEDSESNELVTDELGPYDNPFHLSGQGWLESGKGINESAVNVILPTTQSIALGYGDPNFFDFGIDPQRLVKRTNQKKYENKIEFEKSALYKGVYFIHPADGERHLKNYFDNESVKYTATNIGTKDLEFYLDAKLSVGDELPEGSSEINYLPDAPGVFKSAAEVLEKYYSIWEASTIVRGIYGNAAQRTMLTFVTDLINQQLDYTMVTDEDHQGVFTIAQGNDLAAEQANDFVGTIGGVETTYSGEEVLQSFSQGDLRWDDLDDLIAVTSPSNDPVGMYMAINLATNDESGEDASIPKVKVFTKENNANDATAKNHITVAGTPENYDYAYIDAIDDYKFKMKADRTEPFKTVDFWFTGVSTYNSEVGDVVIPKLDFTWKFSQKVPEVTPKLLTLNTKSLGEYGFTGEFTVNDGDVVFEFDHEVSALYYAFSYNGDETQWIVYDDPSIRTINGKNVTIKIGDWINAASGDRYIKFGFTQGYSSPRYVGPFTLIKEATNP